MLLQIVKGSPDNQVTPDHYHTRRLIELAGMHRLHYPLLVFAREHQGAFTDEQIAKLETLCRQNAQRSLVQLHELTRIANRPMKQGPNMYASRTTAGQGDLWAEASKSRLMGHYAGPRETFRPCMRLPDWDMPLPTALLRIGMQKDLPESPARGALC
jgi:hypothetical protein